MAEKNGWAVQLTVECAVNKKWIVVKNYLNSKAKPTWGLNSAIDFFYGVHNGESTYWTEEPKEVVILNLDQAYDMLFENTLNEKPVLTKVEQLRELKFDHYPIVDKEYSYKHGQDNFFMEKYLDKKTKLVWLHESPSTISIEIDGKKFKELEFEEVIEIVKEKFNK